MDMSDMVMHEMVISLLVKVDSKILWLQKYCNFPSEVEDVVQKKKEALNGFHLLSKKLL